MTIADIPIVSTGLRGQGRRIAASLVLLALLVLSLVQLSRQFRGARGPSSSSFATSSGGLAGLATLLEQQGIIVSQLTVPIAEGINRAQVEANDTLVIVNTELSIDDELAIRMRSTNGYRVVILGDTTLVSEGSLVVISNASPFTNAQLGQGSNAFNAVRALRPNSGGRVVFAEAAHGFQTKAGAGWSAIPPAVRTLLLGLGLGAGAWMLSVGKRIGDPDLPNRLLPPGRFEHVDALASLLRRSPDPQVSSPTSPIKDGS